jgi:chemotaxis signal transduction protein
MQIHPSVLPQPQLPEEADTSSEGTALACLLPYAEHHYAALPIHSGVELVEQPRVVKVPGMPAFCLGLVSWQGKRLPLLDLQAWLGEGSGAPDAQRCSHVLIVAYQRAVGRPIEYGALRAPWLVRMVQVRDSQQCALPPNNGRWAEIAISCFLYHGQAVPVLDPVRLFIPPQSTRTR